MARLPRVTILQLDPGCPPERFDGWLVDAGVRLSQVSLWDHDVPPIASIGDGLVILGGRMSAHDRKTHPWLDDLADLIADAHDIALPTLGICLGHQVLAEALGGTVTVGHPDGPEEGPATLTWLPEAASDPVLGRLVAEGLTTVLESHHDAVTALPAGAVELARTDAFAHQAFRLGESWGVQFHPEATPALLGTWLLRRDADAVVEAAHAVDGRVSASGRAVAEGFAAVVRG